MAIELTITPPPSTNNLFRNQGNIRYATKRYRMWQQAVGWEIKSQWQGTIDGPYVLTIHLPPGIDLDNVKAIPDLLGPGTHGLGLTEDDRQMVELHVFRDRHAKQCRVRIEART